MFSIRLREQTWLEGCEPGEDLCSHGRLQIVIGGHVVADESEDFGIGETALGLLRTLSDDRHSEDEQERLVMHGCGLILMMGCPIGIDWDVEHSPSIVRISQIEHHGSVSGADGRQLDGVINVPREVYREEVRSLAIAVKEFFSSSDAKTIVDPFDQEQYADFWREFDARLAATT